MDLWSRIWRDKRGKVVIWQNPNPFLWGWAILTVISFFFNNGGAANVLTGLASAVLIVWALLELLKGVNYFRRALGLVVLVLAVLALVKSF